MIDVASARRVHLPLALSPARRSSWSAPSLSRRAPTSRNIDNDITAWFSKDDPVYQDYERFREEFGGTRTLIIALKADSADRLFSRDTLEFIAQVTGDIERVDTVQRVDSLATATIVEAIDGAAADDGGLDVRPLIETWRARRRPARRPAPRARRRADPRRPGLGRRRPSTAIIVSFDEDRIDEVRGGVIQQIHDLVDPRLPAGRHARTTTAASRSARPTTASRSTTSASSRRRSCSSRCSRST